MCTTRTALEVEAGTPLELGTKGGVLGKTALSSRSSCIVLDRSILLVKILSSVLPWTLKQGFMYVDIQCQILHMWTKEPVPL